MSMKYNPTADAVYIKYSNKKVGSSIEVNPIMIIDLDKEYNIRGIEIFNVSEMIGEKMRRLTYRREVKISLAVLKTFAESTYPLSN